MISLIIAASLFSLGAGFVAGRFFVPKVSAELKREFTSVRDEFAGIRRTVEVEANSIKAHAKEVFGALAPRQSPPRQVPTRQ